MDALSSQARAFARKHRKFLEENRPDVYAQFKKDGDLNSYLSSVGKQADEMYTTMLMRANNCPEVQNLPFHQRVSRSQENQQSAMEIVLHDVIFQPTSDSEMDESGIEAITPPT
jgi:hypothetical protein